MASVLRLDVDSAFEQKNDIAKAVDEELERVMSAYGFEIVQTLIVDIEPDVQVKKAVNEINVTTRLRLATNEKAEAEKVLQIKKAEGEAESKYLSGLGIVRQCQAIVDGLQDSVLAFLENVPRMTTKGGDVAPSRSSVSVTLGVAVPRPILLGVAVKDVASQIRDGLLQGAQA
ncbi:Hypothetical predicted protein [Olea europaea subsp. europaea]|uniref:Band 7 domain-containing protein n=1 Tax=Olea europaea subsp. europaea TaxID=158383 RepID=A0A8S0RI03_OLEEU|nr:Hypothetical predicted protein [Olea europaea subsp. europaea]